MTGWPWMYLTVHKTQCFQCYSRENTVLVKDSTDSEWIYIIRSGQCAVYMYVESTRASWKDLELCLAHPTIDINGWPAKGTVSIPCLDVTIWNNGRLTGGPTREDTGVTAEVTGTASPTYYAKEAVKLNI
nr:hypothetical protein BaRGS_022038 [Batillaria attramentaria]